MVLPSDRRGRSPSNEADAKILTGVDVSAVPRAFALSGVHPNPFNPRVAVRYAVPGGGGQVRLTIYDLAGRRVRVLVDGVQAAGYASVFWDGADDRGRQVTSRAYICRMEAPGYHGMLRMMLIR